MAHTPLPVAISVRLVRSVDSGVDAPTNRFGNAAGLAMARGYVSWQHCTGWRAPLPALRTPVRPCSSLTRLWLAALLMVVERFTRKVALTDTPTPAKRVVAVDVTGLPMAAVMVPASAHENVATAELMDQLSAAGCADRLEVLLVDRGTSARAATAIGKAHGIEVRRIGWVGMTSSRCSAR